jgi:hypothetical protein
MEENLLAILQSIENRLNSDEYEAGPILTVGGNTNLYLIRSPFNTECEYAIISVSASGTGFAIVSQSNGINIPDTSGATQYGLASTGGDSNPIEGLLINASTNSSKQPPLFWQPLGRGINLYVAITAQATFATFISIAFRRKLNRYIPEPPIRKPNTHSHPTSRRGNRTFQEGFEAQYPHEDYVHEEIPVSQDTAMNTENAPSKAEVLLARMRDAQGKARR